MDLENKENINRRCLREHKQINYNEQFQDSEIDLDNSESNCKKNDDFSEDYEESQERVYNRINQNKKRKRNASAKKSKNQNKNSNQENNNSKDEERENINSKEPKNFGNIIDLASLIKNKKEHPENFAPLKNSDYILIILEICLNSSKYNLLMDNSTKSFWEKLSENKEIFDLLSNFKPETLRKYWRRLRTTYKYKKLINAVKEFSDKLNDEGMKLLSSINAISDYILFPNKGIDHFIRKYEAKISVGTNNNNSNNVVIEENNLTKNLDKYKEMLNEDSFVQLDYKKSIDNIVNILKDAFSNLSENEIIEKLREVNGNIKDAFLYIKDPVNFSYLAFNKNDDEVILNYVKDKGNQEFVVKYNELVNIKGEDKVNKRIEFLNLE